MVKAPTPEEETAAVSAASAKYDQRTGPARQPDQRAALRARRIRLRAAAPQSTATAQRVETGDGRPLPSISRPRSAGSSIGSNCCSSKSRRWRLSGTRCLPRKKSRCQGRRPCYWISMHRARIHRGSLVRRTVPALRQSAPSCFLCRGWRRRLGKVDPSITSREFRKPAILDCGQHSFNSPGYGCAISRNPRWLCGLKNGCAQRRPS